MDLDLRQAVIANLHGASYDDIENTILDALNKGEEKTLPGLGVMFEMLWKASNDDEKSKMVNTISQQIN